MIDFRIYKPADLTELRDLFKRVWGEVRSIEYDKKHWDQTIIGTAPAIVALAGERIVGFYVVWPVPMTDGANDVLAGQPIDSMIDSDFRGRGLLREMGSRCYVECARRSISVMYGAPNNAAVAGNLGSLNWAHATDIVDFVRPVLNRRNSGRLYDTLQNLPSEIDSKAGVTVAVMPAPESLERFATLEKCDTTNRWRVLQSAEWLRYRYTSTPDVKYLTLMLLRHGRVHGGAVCGVRIRNAEDGEEGRLSKLTVGELFAASEADFRCVLKSVAKLGAACGAPYILVKTTNRQIRLSLVSSGFLPVRKTPLIARTLDARCHRANPLSMAGWSLFGGAFDTI